MLQQCQRNSERIQCQRDLALRIIAYCRRELRFTTLEPDDAGLQNRISTGAHDKYGSIHCRRHGSEMVLAGPARDEWEKRQPEQQVQICPENGAIHPVNSVKHVMMIVP